jgi:hypothetical protein
MTHQERHEQWLDGALASLPVHPPDNRVAARILERGHAALARRQAAGVPRGSASHPTPRLSPAFLALLALAAYLAVVVRTAVSLLP